MTRWPGSAPGNSPSTATRPWTGGVMAARSIGWSRSSTPAGHRVAAVDRLRCPGLAPDFRDGHPHRPSREEIGFYACQIRLDAETLARAVRSHWGIENRDHYVRDVTLGEDDSRIRHQPGGMARIRSAALNILRANGVENVSQALYINALNLDHLLALDSS